MVESQPSKLLVAGSIPVSRSREAGVAQLVEHLICNQRVGGSSPFAGSTKHLTGYAGVVEWLMAPGCKPGRLTPYVGSNPTPCTK